MASIIIDDTSNRMEKLNLWTLASTGVRSYGGSSSLFRGVAGVGATVQITFHGTSISLHGTTPPPPAPTFDVMIDTSSTITNQTSRNAYVSPGSYGQWYTTPFLPSGTHTLSVGNLYGASIDYAVVRAGWDTELEGEAVVVDAGAGTDFVGGGGGGGEGGKGPLVFYAVRGDGSVGVGEGWTRREGEFVAADDPKRGLPYGNATMETNVVGAGARFRFTGTSLSIYGIFNYTTPGVLSVIYTIDTFPLTKTYAISPTSPEYTAGTLQRENSLLFANDSLAPGDHTLTLEVARAVNLSLVLDYFVYEAAFPSVGVMPNLTAEAPIAGVSSSSDTSTNTDANGTGEAQRGGGGGKKSVGAIVGGVVSGLVVLCVVVGLLWWWKRKRAFSSKGRDHKNMTSPTPFSDGHAQTRSRPGPTSVSPYTLSASPTYPSPSTPQRTIREKLSMPISLASDPFASVPSSSSAPPPPPPPPPPLDHLPSRDEKRGGFLGLATVTTPMPLPTPTPTHLPPRFSISNPSVGVFSPHPLSDPSSSPHGEQAGAGVFGTSRMQRLQELVLELDTEIAERGDGTGRVGELRERIAVLSREGLDGAGGNGDGGEEREGDGWRNTNRETMRTLPPPYELRE